MDEETFIPHNNNCGGYELNFQYLQDTIDMIGTRWRVQILYSITMCGTHRFREIERNVPGLSTRMLSRELKLLEGLGLVTRTVEPTKPVTVEYRETELCHTLIPVYDAMLRWGSQYGKHTKKAPSEK